MEFFAAANTRNGFMSMFDTVFGGIERLYILKGSSGCGKSTFMRRVAAEAQKKGYKTDLIYCSSDLDSLDGVIINELGVAVADGTAPHTMDVKYPCVRESIINLGQFWNEAKLLPHADKIIALTDRKGKHYKNAYNCLSALGTVNDMIDALVADALDRARLESAAFRLADKVMGGDRHGCMELYSSAFGSGGLQTKQTFGKIGTLYRVSGRGAGFMLSAVWQIARERNAYAIASRDPIDPALVDSIWFPLSDTLVSLRDDPPCAFYSEEKKIAMTRFLDSSRLTAARARLKLLDRTAIALTEEAKNEFALAKELHNAIESIYIPAMDFSAVDIFTESFCKRITEKKA